MLLPDPKLSDKAKAKASAEKLAQIGADAVIVGDGWHLFSGGVAALRALAG